MSKGLSETKNIFLVRIFFSENISFPIQFPLQANVATRRIADSTIPVLLIQIFLTYSDPFDLLPLPKKEETKRGFTSPFFSDYSWLNVFRLFISQCIYRSQF